MGNNFNLNYQYTKKQVARGARPDGERNNEICLIKYSSTLNLTYQIKLLTYMCFENKLVLIIVVYKDCEIKPKLKTFIKKFGNLVKIKKEEKKWGFI